MSAPTVASRPDAAPLSSDALQHLRHRLLGELAFHAEQVIDCRATVHELTGQTDVDSVLEREIAEASLAHSKRAITDIELAVERLHAGTFGQCEQCDRPIAAERLKALPHARLCVACAARPANVLS